VTLYKVIRAYNKAYVFIVCASTNTLRFRSANKDFKRGRFDSFIDKKVIYKNKIESILIYLFLI